MTDGAAGGPKFPKRGVDENPNQLSMEKLETPQAKAHPRWILRRKGKKTVCGVGSDGRLNWSLFRKSRFVDHLETVAQAWSPPDGTKESQAVWLTRRLPVHDG